MLPTHLVLVFLVVSFPVDFLYTVLFSPTGATCPANLILLGMMILIILGEEYNPHSCSI
jgi:hypothetical protein